MPSFGHESEAQLQTCHAEIQAIFRKIVQWFNCKVLEGHRNQQKQHEAFTSGHSKLDWPNGNHNALPSNAVDVAPFPVDFGGKLIDVNPVTKVATINKKNLLALCRFYHFAGAVEATAQMLGTPVRWGGDWDSDNDFSDQTFNDLVHFERLNK